MWMQKENKLMIFESIAKKSNSCLFVKFVADRLSGLGGIQHD